jgi:hypothetical protein
MVTFREDQDVVEVYDGSAFKTVGGLVAVKSALKTDTFTASVGAGGNVAVTDLSITHEVSDPANRLIISAFFGAAANSNQAGNVGIAVHDGTGLIAVGDAGADQTQVTAGGFISQTGAGNAPLVVSMPSATFVHTPGTGSKTYTVRALNVDDTTRTVYINRAESDVSSESRPRAVSSLVIQEVAV